MVNYTCDRCEKVFSDKTKYSLHISRKNPCKKIGFIQKKEEHLPEDDIEENVIKVVDSFSNYCRLCKCNYRNEESSMTFVEHLLEKHQIRKMEKIFRFTKKTSGVTLFENEKEAGDIVIIGFQSGKGVLFTTTNLHNLQRHKKDKYRNMSSWTYYPCKNIPLFKLEWNQFIKSNVDENEEEYPIIWLESEVIKIVKKINQQEWIEKTECSYREGFYYECPFCHETVCEIEEIESHLIKSHRFLKHDTSKLELNSEQENHLLAIIHDPHSKTELIQRNPIEEHLCKYCHTAFVSSFLLQKHMKEKCRRSAFYLENDTNIDDLMERNEKLRMENELLKEALISNQEMMKDQNETLKKSVSYVKTTNIIQNNNILFNVNDFGKEDLSHIEGEFVEDVIQQMSTNSLIKFIEEVHYGNPRNCNVIIPPQSKDQQENMLLLKKGDRWIMDSRQNVLDDMITINIERITDVYDEINIKLTEEVQTNFQNYVAGADQRMIRDEAISETENLIKRRQPMNKFLLENARIQQNQFIDGQWSNSIDTSLPMIQMDAGNMSEKQIMNWMDGPSTQIQMIQKERPTLLDKVRNKK